MKYYFVVTTILFTCILADDTYNVSKRRFPKNFKFGTASAAYQIEGGWNADGKGESVWDRATHTHPEKFSGDNGDVACDSYHKWEEDIRLLKEIGVNTYRFSIAWSRVLPTGFVNSTNPAGVTYYKNLIAELKKNNIEPLITMHHWDIPQALEDIGGFLNDKFQDIFLEYARFLFGTFGDEVKDWVTFNEPKQTCLGGYGEGSLAPLVIGNGVNEYKCAHNLILAHAKAYRLYQNDFKAKQNGRVTMVIDSTWFEPASNNADDIEAAERRLLFTYGWFAHPLKYGDYPEIMKQRIKDRSLLEGFNVSRLPAFTDREKEEVKGTVDYFTINIYTSSMVKAIPEPEIVPFKPTRDLDCGVKTFQPDEWEPTVASWFKVVPWGARKLIKWISDTYDHPEIVVTENGYQDNGTVIHDLQTRGRYHKLYLSNIQDAMYKDGANVTGYMAWSLTDDFEWQFGYKIALGFYQIDFTDPNRTRTRKDSATYYSHVVRTGCLVPQEECTA